MIIVLLGNASELVDHQVCLSECPTWFVPVNNNDIINCNCGDSLDGGVLCDKNSNMSMLHFQDCMTYDEVNNSTVSAAYKPFHSA